MKQNAISLPVLSFIIVATVLFFGVFAIFFAQMPTGRGLDFVFTIKGLKATLGEFSANDIARHEFGTRVLDTALPIAYGIAATLAIFRYFSGRKKRVLILLLIIAILADFTENYFNIALLNGGDQFGVHVMLTWVKFGALTPPIAMALSAWGAEILRFKRA